MFALRWNCRLKLIWPDGGRRRPGTPKEDRVSEFNEVRDHDSGANSDQDSDGLGYVAAVGAGILKIGAGHRDRP